MIENDFFSKFTQLETYGIKSEMMEGNSLSKH